MKGFQKALQSIVCLTQFTNVTLAKSTVFIFCIGFLATSNVQALNMPPIEAINGTLSVDSSGAGTLTINLEARKVVSSNVFYVDVTSTNGDGSQATPFTDLPDAFAHISSMGYTSAVINLSSGNYTWGHATDPDGDASAHAFKAGLTIIGQGSSQTKVIQGSNDLAAAIFNEPGKSLYIEGVDFVGIGTAGSAFNEETFDARNGPHLTLVDTIFRNAHNGDGAKILFWETVVIYNSKALDNDADGFSYSHKSSFTSSPMYVVEYNADSIGNGVNGQSNSQGSSTHRHTEIVRINGEYSNNPVNIEDTGPSSWNVNLTVKNATNFQSHESGFVNIRVRGDKLEGSPLGSGTNSNVWLMSGSYNQGGLIHAHSTTSSSGNPIHGFIRYSSLFDIESHLPDMSADSAGAEIINPADDTYLPGGGNQIYDNHRVTALNEIKIAMESYGAANESYVVSGSGSNGNGKGNFHLKDGNKYLESIANILVNDGHLNAPAPADLLHTNPGSYSIYDFMIFPCLDRVGVFSRADSIQPDPTDLTWWTDNNCSQTPISTYSHTYFVLSTALEAPTSPDEHRVTALNEILQSLESYGVTNETYVVSGGGSNGNGKGNFHLIDGNKYLASIANILVNDGHLSAPAPADLLHTNPGSYSIYDFMVYTCLDRVAVFSLADSIQPDSVDIAWWTDNNCSQTPISTYSHTYFVLSTALVPPNPDEFRVTALDEIILSLESYGTASGSYVVSGGGSNGNGKGNFHLIDGNKYLESIANILVDDGHLNAPAPADLLHNIPGSYSIYDFMVFPCLDRVAVFSIADSIQPNPTDLIWWTDNNCSQTPISTYNHTYFTLSVPLE